MSMTLPNNFKMDEKGLFFDDEWICSPIKILSYIRDTHNENWGRLIQFHDLDHHLHQRAIAMEMLTGDCAELYGLLLSLGVRLTPKRSLRHKLPDYLQNTKLEKRAICTTRIGWYKDYFILPDGSIPSSDEIYLQSDNHNFTGYGTLRTLEEWQKNIAKPCRYNTRLVFALSCAFAAPLLPLLNAESGGFNFKGASSIGKSTALSVAASVWGNPHYIQQWKTTGNALEAMAEAHNHALLCLDELGQVDGKEAGEIAYMLANGQGKNRLKAKGGLRKKFEWNLLFLSTGEISLGDKINESGKKVQAGMLVRMIDIPADAGQGYRLFDTLHDFQDGSQLANHLKEATSKSYGTAIRSFIPHLINSKYELSQKMSQLKTDFLNQYIAKDVNGQVKRVADRFILVALAGELAIEFGILPYSEGEAFSAVGHCFLSWLETRPGNGCYEIETALNQVRSFIEINHSSRFAVINKEYLAHNMLEERVFNQVGYKRKTAQGNYEFFVFPASFDQEICKGFDPKLVKAELAAQNLLLRDNNGKYTRPIRLPQINGTKRMIHLDSSIFIGE